MGNFFSFFFFQKKNSNTFFEIKIQTLSQLNPKTSTKKHEQANKEQSDTTQILFW